MSQLNLLNRMQMAQSLIKLKGRSFTLTVLYIHDKNPEAIKKAIQEKINKAPAFFKNAPIVFNVTGLLDMNTISSCYKIISEIGLKIVGVSGCTDTKLCQAITDMGIPLLNEGENQKIQNQNTTNITTTEYGKTCIITTHVRSGQRIYAPNCDLIVNANVSAGAELIADGNIHIYGIMRGRVLAGASGDHNCQIYCTNLKAELVSIAGQFWLSDQIPTDFIGKATKLYVINNELTIDNII